MIFCAIFLSFVCSPPPLCKRFKIKDKYFIPKPSENRYYCSTAVLDIEIPANLQPLSEVNKICRVPYHFDSSHECEIKLTDHFEIYFYKKCNLANNYFNVKNNVLEDHILCEETGDNIYDINYFCQITKLQSSLIEDGGRNCKKGTFNNNHYFRGECVLNRPYFSINGDSTSEHLSCASNRDNIFDIKKFCRLTKSTSTLPAILFSEKGECNTFIKDEINYYGKCSFEKPFFYKNGVVLDDFIQCEETDTAHNLIKACEIPKSSERFTVDKSKCSSKDKDGKYFSEKCTNTDSNASGNLIRCDKGDLLCLIVLK
ncbi:hypothetical protein MHBO_003293 [Bonamia ostreae]|uniref:Uncharacterized protein n=1 Tax=Bonamia ostreae TaxID=126728 RepID=A0ABV2AQ05_9EUKA